MPIWVFDNDGTLYEDSGAEKSFMDLLYTYVERTFLVKLDHIPELLNNLRKKHRTSSSVIALVREGMISDINELITETYDRIDLQSSNARLTAGCREALARLHGPKVVLTNNPSRYARRVLDSFSITNRFEHVVGMVELEFKIKPDIAAFQKIQSLYPGSNDLILCDDRLENITAAAQLGWQTVLYNPNGDEVLDGPHRRVRHFEKIASVP